MDIVHARVAAIDVGKRESVVCVRLPSVELGGEWRQEVRTFGTATKDLLALRDWLTGQEVTTVVLEATGQYWRGAFYVLEEAVDVILVNPAHVKGLPGRKTDVLDAVWLCRLAECGLVRASFVPPEPVRQLRDLTRHRASLLGERTRQVQRLEKTLEDAQVKISSVLTDLLGASGRAMLEALIAGERDPVVLAGRAKGRLRARIPELIDALEGRFTEHHAFLCRQHMRLIDEITELLDELAERITDAMRPWERQVGLLQTIPGVGRCTAETIVAETGALTERFPTPGHLASWAGVTPGHYQSAGKVNSSRTGPGSRWLAAALGLAALSAGRSKYTYLGARYRRLAPQIGGQRANVALQHDILIAVWHMLKNDQPYRDPGGDYYDRKDPEGTRRHAVAQLRRLGFHVELSKTA
ncbi:IS110 family transposase [Actinospica acidithermotolerans]|uniref:IS110 family transposase n=1 Tax=Actinospica acidithermotolerans TaxID=2828514 RepID=UPI001BAD996A|nr:IS110 family transposase [Actinospica acidithermotolerans]